MSQHTGQCEMRVRKPMVDHEGVSENSGTPKSSISIGFSIINHPFWGIPIFGNTHEDVGGEASRWSGHPVSHIRIPRYEMSVDVIYQVMLCQLGMPQRFLRQNGRY